MLTCVDKFDWIFNMPVKQNVSLEIDLVVDEKYAICWTDDPTVRIVRYCGVERGFLIFKGTEDGERFVCRQGTVIIRRVLR